MRKKSIEERYRYSIRKQQKALEEFAEYEFEWAEDLMLWYKLLNKEMPEDEYRACAFFRNREYKRKPGSLTLLYQMYLRCISELPSVTKELAFDLLAFRYRMYAETLKRGGYNGQPDS